MADEPIKGLPPGAVAEPIQGLPPGATIEPIGQSGSGVGHVLSEGWDEAKSIVSGILGAFGPPRNREEWGRYGMDPTGGQLLLHRLLIDPTVAKYHSFEKAGAEGRGQPYDPKTMLAFLSMLNPVSPDVTKLWDQSMSGDTSGAAARGAVDVGALLAGSRSSQAADAAEAAGNLGREFKGGADSTNVMLHDRAIEVQGHVQQVQRNLHHVANEAYQDVVKAVDQANPDGVLPQSAVRNVLLRNLREYNHLDLPLPKTLRDVMAEPEGPLTNEPMASFQWLSDIQKLIGQNMKRGDLSQPIQQALNKSYGQVANLMRKVADSVDPELGARFSEANGLYKQYYSDFAPGTPFGRILEGQNAKDILGELNGPNRELLRRQLNAYKEYGADPKGVQNDAKAYKLAKTKNIVAKSFSRLGSVIPFADMVGYPVDRFMKTPTVINMRAGRGPYAPDFAQPPIGAMSPIMNFPSVPRALPPGSYSMPPSGLGPLFDALQQINPQALPRVYEMPPSSLPGEQ
jgi:hypothetical protein